METTRMIKSRLGALIFKVPNTREGLDLSVLECYQRSERAFLSSIGEMAMKGVSTDKLKKLAESFFGYPIPIQTVVGLCKSLNGDIRAWRQRRLDEAYPYIIVNTRNVKIRVNRIIVEQEVLIVAGVNEFSKRRILEFILADSEDEVIWRGRFNSLKERGLHGVKLLVSDDLCGIVEAAKHCFKGVSWQRCQAHFIKDALTKLSGKRPLHGLKKGIVSVIASEARQSCF